MDKSTVIIIGGGQIGSRHLQSIVQSPDAMSVFVVDPSPDALRRAQARVAEVIPAESKVKVVFTQQLDDRIRSCDIAIIATSSDVRRSVIEHLLSRVDVRYMIVEKVAFQSDYDFECVSRLLNEKGTTAWVNCPRREWALYQDLRTKLPQSSPFECHVSGSNWGLACNAIHFLDLLAYLTQDTRMTVSTADLDTEPFPSKRKGFLEFSGTLRAQTDAHKLTLTCYRGGDAPILVQLHGENFRYIIRENEGRLWSSHSEDQWRWQELNFFAPYQSQLTIQVVQSIFATGQCSLTSFAESQRLHRPLLDAFLRHLQEQTGRELVRCPIT